jgi:hypothetical protein
VLIMEAIIIGLAIPVALNINHASHRATGTVGGILVLAAIVLAAVAGRGPLRLVLVAGSVLQAVVLAAGVIVPAMYFLGAVFALLWAIGVWLGYRFEQVS